MCWVKLEMNVYKQNFDSNMKKKLGEVTENRGKRQRVGLL